MNDLLEYARRSAARNAARGDQAGHTGERPTPAPAPPARSNRKVRPRRTSTFNVVTVLFAAGIAIVLYINNILTVNRLAYDVKALQSRADSLANVDVGLRALLSREQAQDRISGLASSGLQMQAVPADRPAVVLHIDAEKLDRLRTQEQR
jgi:hypothetical protein